MILGLFCIVARLFLNQSSLFQLRFDVGLMAVEIVKYSIKSFLRFSLLKALYRRILRVYIFLI